MPCSSNLSQRSERVDVRWRRQWLRAREDEFDVCVRWRCSIAEQGMLLARSPHVPVQRDLATVVRFGAECVNAKRGHLPGVFVRLARVLAPARTTVNVRLERWRDGVVLAGAVVPGHGSTWLETPGPR